MAAVSRRFLNHAAMGLGAAVLGSLIAKQSTAAVPGLPHFKPRANRVIFLFMGGAPVRSNCMTTNRGWRICTNSRCPTPFAAANAFGYDRRQRETDPAFDLQVYATRQLRPLHERVAAALSTVVDDCASSKSMRTEAINHDEGKTQMCTGSQIQGKPSLGAWLSYGLGSLNSNLPDFIVLNSAFWSGDQQNVQALYSRLWGTGFLPSKYQGVCLSISRRSSPVFV